ncbi:MAG TPA: hypothetical protein VF228_16340 [Iamia sp.]
MSRTPTMRSRRPRTIVVVALFVLAVVVGVLPTRGSGPLAPAPAAAVPWWQPIIGPGGLDQIEPDETRDVNGWRYTRYRNEGAPCSMDGVQSFLIGTRIDAPETATAPLWVRMRGGGAGWFEDGVPMPSAAVKSEEDFATHLHYDTQGLMADAKAEIEPLRVLIVSMCSHDLYGGMNSPDPGNIHGDDWPTTGLTSLVAALAYTTAQYPTDDYVLHGTSAGGVGTFHVAMALQMAGYPPTALVSDSGVGNHAWQEYVAANPPDEDVCEKVTQARIDGVDARIDPRVADPANEPHLLVSTRRLLVPVAHVWNLNDHNVCGKEMLAQCPLADGMGPAMRAARCNHEPLRRALLGLGPLSTSMEMRVCVEGDDPTVRCDRHLVTAGPDLTNDPNMNEWPADYQAELLDWVLERLAED